MGEIIWITHGLVLLVGVGIGRQWCEAGYSYRRKKREFNAGVRGVKLIGKMVVVGLVVIAVIGIIGYGVINVHG